MQTIIIALFGGLLACEAMIECSLEVLSGAFHIHVSTVYLWSNQCYYSQTTHICTVIYVIAKPHPLQEVLQKHGF